MASPLRQSADSRKSVTVEDRVTVTLSSFTRDGETAFRARGQGFQGLAVVAPTAAMAKREAKEVLAALRRARGENAPYRVVFVEN